MRALRLGLLAALALSATTVHAQDPAWQCAATMHRGVNILGYDPIWKDSRKGRFKWHYFETIHRGGFDFVRVVLQAFAHMDAANRVDPKWLATLDRVVAEANAAHLSVIIDEHDFNRCSDAPDSCESKLLAFWQQIGTRYRDAPDTVLFELLNEPHGKLDAARWNALLGKLIPAVRATNPNRTLVIGPTHWNSLAELPTLELPPQDRNILVTFHYYEPFRFTHQGAPWVADTKGLKDIPLTVEDEARIGHDFDQVAAWSKATDRPVLLGEFGAYDKSGTPIADRVRYASTVRREAEARGFAWAYWQFDGDFIVYDVDRNRWIEPIRAVLISP